MTNRARLLGLRLQGFKSFADRTAVEFGPGISAVVGPNGSGKSNLADALRWALGEQGRSLRIRKSEDVVWAGSQRRPAVGMADVALVIDNGDGLLPVDFATIEIGRRLYRSGENDYLLNRQRVRLRDLVDLLDAAALAENAFLFIGQGMVDQALALRPEERRPLFEEVAGVRRPERRRRRAEAQLAESEANLARVEDILAELRPQARRLAAQAEQQASRATAAEDLVEALVASGHVRWSESAARVEAAASLRVRVTGEAATAMTALTDAETEAAAVAAALAARAEVEVARRTAHDAARATLTEHRLTEGRLAAERGGIERDRARLATEVAAAEAGLAVQRRTLTEALPAPDHDLEAAAVEAERALADATAELTALQAASRDRDAERAAVGRARAAREAELDGARRRADEAERRAVAAATEADALASRRTDLEGRQRAASDDLAAAEQAVADANATETAARTAAATREAERRSVAERLAGIRMSLAETRGRRDALTARVADDETRGIARAARRRGGRRVDEDLVVEPGLRAAVEAVLAERARAYVVDRDVAVDLAGERGILVVEERAADSRSRRGPARDAIDPRDRRCLDRIADLGGAALGAAVQRDPTGAAARLLARAAWLPDLEACLAVQADLAPGWLVVPRDGSAVVSPLDVTLGRPEPHLERRGQLSRLEAEAERLASEVGDLETQVAAADEAAAAARAALVAARQATQAADAGRRRIEAAERAAARELDAVLREARWSEAQAVRLAAEAARAAEARGEAEAALATMSPAAPEAPVDDRPAVGTWERRVAELRTRRDALAGQLGERAAARRAAEARRTRAEAAAAFAEERIARAATESAGLDERDERARVEAETLTRDLAEAVATEAAAAAALAELRTADAADRSRLAAAEAAAAAARERLRAADERVRAADRAELEARLGHEALREQLLVELAGIGGLAVERLETIAGRATGDTDAATDGGAAAAEATIDGAADAEAAKDDTAEPGDDASARLQAALEAAGGVWATTPPSAAAPGAARLGQLRRRFHELGAANPDAVGEYRTLRARLDELETQDRDLRSAIARTRQLIAELDELIATQFRTTFRALEAAFEARFSQLFGGGFARLVLTDPEDLAATGVEIVAQPPGRKPQALAMLSGGERALTAVALLFAMLEVRPVPFCVLDEVDAALDEANIGRFTAALRDLAGQTQFIVITHNRGTIESADALYGVTIGDDSVSRIVSLRLEEAREIAERQFPASTR